MTYKLFIDDERFPTDSTCVIARSSHEAMQVVITRGIPDVILFDHDLGSDDTSMVFLHAFIDHVLGNGILFPRDFTYSIHSQNPVGSENIKSLMNSFLSHMQTHGLFSL